MGWALRTGDGSPYRLANSCVSSGTSPGSWGRSPQLRQEAPPPLSSEPADHEVLEGSSARAQLEEEGPLGSREPHVWGRERSSRKGRARRVLTGSDDGFHLGPGALGTCQRTGGREMTSLTTFHEDPLSDGLEEGLGRGGGSEGLKAEGREEVIGV